MSLWRVSTHNATFIKNAQGQEVLIEAEYVTVEEGIAKFFKKEGEKPFVLINMYGVFSIVDIEKMADGLGTVQTTNETGKQTIHVKRST
jgi:hypothetical protein